MGVKIICEAKIEDTAQLSILENGKSLITFFIATDGFKRSKEGDLISEVTRYKCKKYLNGSNPGDLSKLTKGTKIIILGILCYEKYDIKVSGSNLVNTERPYIDVQVVEFSN